MSSCRRFHLILHGIKFMVKQIILFQYYEGIFMNWLPLFTCECTLPLDWHNQPLGTKTTCSHQKLLTKSKPCRWEFINAAYRKPIDVGEYSMCPKDLESIVRRQPVSSSKASRHGRRNIWRKAFYTWRSCISCCFAHVAKQEMRR